MLNRMRELCALFGVSGCEDEVREYIRLHAIPYADEIRTDAIGNLIVKKSGFSSGRSIMLAAHMDEVGMIVTAVTDEGFLKFDFVGGVDRRVALGKRVLIGEKRIPGLIGMKAAHLVEEDEQKTIPKTRDLYIDIGAENKEEAQAKVSLGDYVAFDSAFSLFGDGFIKAKAIDDRFGCAVLLKLLSEPLPVDCTFAFTAQEEVGTRGAFSAAFSETPEVALVLEGTTAADLPGSPGHKKVCQPGHGAVIPFMDGATIYDRELFHLLRGIADQKGIPWQTKQFISGGTDAKAIQRTKTGVRTACLAAPVRYIHSPSSVVNLKDMEAVYAIAKSFLDTMGRRAEG
jgi:endoglucanase